MFASVNHRSKLTARRLALLAAPLAVLGAGASTANAAGFGDWWHRSSPRVVIHAEFPGRHGENERRIERDEVPAGLQMQAFQSKDRVIVIVSGTNRGADFQTSLSAVSDGRETSLVLRNRALDERCREGATCFTVTGSFCSPRELRTVCMRIGDRVFEIPVTCVQSLT